jgi:hypothetical protein
MMGRQRGDQSQLFYLFNLERRIPARHLLPPRRHGSFHLLKDDGVGLTVMTTMAVGSKPLDLNREKISLQDLYPLSLVAPSERHCLSTTC